MNWWKTPTGKVRHLRRDCSMLDAATRVERCDEDELRPCSNCGYDRVATLEGSR